MMRIDQRQHSHGATGQPKYSETRFTALARIRVVAQSLRENQEDVSSPCRVSLQGLMKQTFSYFFKPKKNTCIIIGL